MNLATIIVLLIIGAGVYWSISTLRRTGGRRCGGCCDGCSGGTCETHHDHAKHKAHSAADDSCPCCHKK